MFLKFKLKNYLAKYMIIELEDFDTLQHNVSMEEFEDELMIA